MFEDLFGVNELVERVDLRGMECLGLPLVRDT